MSKKKESKTKYQAQDTVLVEISTTARVSFEELDIFPEGMDRSQIKAKLIKRFSEMIDDSPEFKVGSFKVKILDQTTTSRSQPLTKTEEEIK